MNASLAVRACCQLVTLVLFVACASSASRTAPARPAPVALPPVENLPPVVQPLTPAPQARVFAYTPGLFRYEIRNEATIAALGGEQRVDTITTRTVISYRLTRALGDSIEVQGTVDTFTVAGGHGAPIQPSMQPVPFRFMATPSGMSAPSVVDSASVCGAPMSALMVVAHDLLPTIVVPLSNSAEWQDSTVSATCRAMIPVISRGSRSSRAEWVVIPADFTDASSHAGYRILRTTTGTLAGEGQAAGRQVLLTGTSSSTSALYVDPVSGVLVGGVGDATTRLIVDTGTQRQEFVQQLRQHIVRLP